MLAVKMVIVMNAPDSAVELEERAAKRRRPHTTVDWPGLPLGQLVCDYQLNELTRFCRHLLEPTVHTILSSDHHVDQMLLVRSMIQKYQAIN